MGLLIIPDLAEHLGVVLLQAKSNDCLQEGK
jgi:hypothetical protein